mgnify:CR=1 FL=1
MRIAIIGTRGIPANYGGFETYAEELAPRLNALCNTVTVSCHSRDDQLPDYKGVALKYSQFKKASNPIRFYFETLRQAVKENDVLLIAGVGGAIFYPFLRRKKAVFVTNIDGIESKRSKWSYLKKLYLKIGEIMAVRFSNYIIADSSGIKEYIAKTYGKTPAEVVQLEYGADLNTFFSK